MLSKTNTEIIVECPALPVVEIARVVDLKPGDCGDTLSTTQESHWAMPKKVLTILALSAVSLGASGVAQASSSIASNPNNTTDNYPVDKPLRRISSLPGWKMKVSDAQRKALQGSTVQIVKKPRDMDVNSGWGWQGGCTANLVKVGNETDITTSNHCVTEATGDKYGLLYPQQGGSNSLDFSRISPDVYGFRTEFFLESGEPVTSDNVRPDLREAQPMARANGLAVSLEGKDIALLSIDPSTIVTDSSPDSDSVPRRLGQVFPIKNTALPKPPKVGQPVAMYRMAYPRPVAGTGRYIGRRVDIDGQVVDDVVVGAYSPSQDPCYFGGSGGRGKFAANGRWTGPLSRRLNIGYGPGRTQLDSQDGADPYSLVINKQTWHGIERAYGIKLPESAYQTMCSFAVEGTNTLTRLRASIGSYAVTQSP